MATPTIQIAGLNGVYSITRPSSDNVAIKLITIVLIDKDDVDSVVLNKRGVTIHSSIATLQHERVFNRIIPRAINACLPHADYDSTELLLEFLKNQQNN